MKDVIVYSEKQYRMAIKEFLVVLSNIPRADYEKIPKDVIEDLKNNADNTYDFSLDMTKNFSEQNISELTKAMIENFYRDYWVTDIEKQKILEEERNEFERLEEEKRKKYNPDDIFKNKTEVLKNGVEQKENLAMIEQKEKNFLEKILEKIMKIFKKTK